jgi:hypothetical protein
VADERHVAHFLSRTGGRRRPGVLRHECGPSAS